MRVHTGLRSHSRSNQEHTERHYRVKCDACKKQTTAYHGVCDNCGEYPGIVSSYGACPHDPIHTWKERGECIRQSAKERKRVRHVFSSGEIPHLWFHKTQASAKNSNGSFFFEDDTIYSWGTHFPIARHVQSQSGKRSAVLFTTKTYSVSTSSHCSAVRTAIPEGTQVFNVPQVFTEGRYISEEQGRYASNEHANNLTDYADRVSAVLAKCVRARQSYQKQYAHSLAIELREEARQYAKFFRLPMPKIAPIPPLDSKQLAAIKKREAVASAKKAEKTRLENIEQTDETLCANCGQPKGKHGAKELACPDSINPETWSENYSFEPTARRKVWKKQFKTRLEAKRFAEGVDFVNDTALLVVIVKNKGRNKGYRVEITDTDYHEDD